MGEFLGAEKESDNSERTQTQAAHAPRSICHYAPSARHERGYQALGMSMIPAIWKFLSVEVTISEVQNDVEVFPINIPLPLHQMSL